MARSGLISEPHRTRQKRVLQPRALHDKKSYPYVITLMKTGARVHQKRVFVRQKNGIKKGPVGPLIEIDTD
ncbi:hypothetical protein FDX05_22590 [Citrobacter sp. wls715]|uniref:Uncharacterized protein n=1 Tax=Citrobacter pasteurii TaxID=1563222 RepID=A0A6N6K606_9ENTR|nr:hypothetical protein DXF85_05330 [Citrobacter pasteurii]TKU52935.1 hypothetical protein FDX05_22590 [Citrobacter sp. wls715]